MSGASVPLRFADDTVKVQAKPSEVHPDQLDALRRHKAELLPILAAFGTATVEIRPPTPIPAEPRLGDWVWSHPLPPRRGKVRERALPAAGGWQGPGPDPQACVICGDFCDPRDLSCGRRIDGAWSHLSCWLKTGDFP
ncbi:MAG: hypothetical protein ACJ8H8_29555 [Geminicoccaceae bacterium]